MFTDEEIGMLAELERDFDSGKKAYVISGGSRMLVNKELMDKFKLIQGQTISPAIQRSIIQHNLSKVVAEIAIEKAMAS